MKNVKGGVHCPSCGGGGGGGGSTCSESCGSGVNAVSCSSSVGNCSRDGNNSITCDGQNYKCPA